MTLDGGSPCADAGHLFCDDFDDGPLGARWVFQEATGGPLSLDTAAFVSPPKSFRVELMPSAGVKSSLLHQDINIPGKTHAVLEFDLRVDRVGTQTYKEIDYGALAFAPPPPNMKSQGLAIVDTPGSIRFQYYRERSGGGYDYDNKPLALPIGTWAHVVLAVHMTGPTGVISINSVEMGSFPLQTSTLTAASFEMGSTWMEGNTTSNTIHVDNVTFDAN